MVNQDHNLEKEKKKQEDQDISSMKVPMSTKCSFLNLLTPLKVSSLFFISYLCTELRLSNLTTFWHDGLYGLCLFISWSSQYLQRLCNLFLRFMYIKKELHEYTTKYLAITFSGNYYRVWNYCKCEGQNWLAETLQHEVLLNISCL